VRTSHTTTTQKAKCLHYRNGSRCGRMGKVLVSYQDRQGYHRSPVCQECAGIIEAQGGRVLETSSKGYHVIPGQFTNTREYRRIV